MPNSLNKVLSFSLYSYTYLPVSVSITVLFYNTIFSLIFLISYYYILLTFPFQVQLSSRFVPYHVLHTLLYHFRFRSIISSFISYVTHTSILSSTTLSYLSTSFFSLSRLIRYLSLQFFFLSFLLVRFLTFLVFSVLQYSFTLAFTLSLKQLTASMLTASLPLFHSTFVLHLLCGSFFTYSRLFPF